MSIKIKSLRCVDFRSFEDVTFEFGTLNIIEGENYRGKTSISEAVAVLLLGTNLSGNAQVGEFIRRGTKKFELTGIFVMGSEGDAEQEEHEIVRVRDSRGMKTFLDGNPSTQAEIDRFIGSKERFLTVFSPGYFSGLSNQAAREMLVGLTKRPKPEEIVGRLSGGLGSYLVVDISAPDANEPKIVPLKELRDPDTFAKSIRADIKSNEAERNRIEGRIQAYQEQLRAEPPVVPIFDPTELNELRAEMEDLRSGGTIQRINEMDNERRSLKRRLDSIRLQDVPGAPHALGEPCPMCLRPLDESSLEDVLRHHHTVVEEIEDSNAEKLTEQVELQERIDNLSETIDTLAATVNEKRIDEIVDEIRHLENLEYEFKAGTAKFEQHLRAVESAAANINKAETEKAELERESFDLSERLKAVGAFRQELVKVQVDSIRQHLNRVGIELFKVTQDGEIKDDFSLTYDGKDFKVLSTSERIRVNLEIASLFNTILGLDFPVFIDNAESITHYEQPNTSQLFLARVVDGAELKLEVEE